MNELLHLLKINPFNRIMFGLVLMIAGQYMSAMTGGLIFQLPFAIVAWYFIIPAFKNIKGKRLPFTGFYKGIFILYAIAVIIMLLRGFLSDVRQYENLKGMIHFYFVSPSFFIAYFVPLVVFIPKEYFSLKMSVKCATIIGVLSLFVVAISYQQIVQTSMLLNAGLIDSEGNISGFRIYESFAFIALCGMYLTKRQWICNLLGLGTVLFTTLIFARRGGSVTGAVLLIISLYYWAKSNKSFAVRLFMYIASVAVIGFIAYQVLYSDMFAFLHARGFEDTRSHVEEALLEQMTEFDMWFGKGLNGRYWLPLSPESEGWRYGCETGFLNYVLKGGYVMIGLYIILLLVPAIKGLWHSNNYLCKIGGVYMILSLLELYPFGIFIFNTKFFIIWMMASICMSKKWRMMNDEEIKKRIFS